MYVYELRTHVKYLIRILCIVYAICSSIRLKIFFFCSTYSMRTKNVGFVFTLDYRASTSLHIILKSNTQYFHSAVWFEHDLTMLSTL